MTEYSPAKTGEYPRIFPNFQNFLRCEKDLKDNKHNSLHMHLGQKYARIFVLGHYLFLVAHSFPRAALSENCSLLGTDNVRGQISEHIFAPNGDYCLYIFAPNGGYCLSNLWNLIRTGECSWLGGSLASLLDFLLCASFNNNKRLLLAKHFNELMRKILEVSETLVYVQEQFCYTC